MQTNTGGGPLLIWSCRQEVRSAAAEKFICQPILLWSVSVAAAAAEGGPEGKKEGRKESDNHY